MLSIENVDKSLSLAIPTNCIQDHNNSDITKLLTSYSVIEAAKDSFLSQEINFEEYIDLCEMHEVNIDNYLESIEHNLIELKLI